MRKFLLFTFYFLLFTLLSGCTLLPPGIEKMIPGRGAPQYGGEMCIDPSQIGTTPILTNIPKPDENNIPFAGSPSPWVNCKGQGSCTGPNTADYVMVRENVKMDPIWPDNRTTRLVKQILPGDSHYDSVRQRVYRATCNDWCGLNLPVGGTLFCDFIFLLQANEQLVDREVKPGVFEPYPKDGAMFDVLIRQGAEIPQYIGQPGKRKPLRCDLITPTPGTTSFNWLLEEFSGNSFAQDKDSFISVPDPAEPTKTARFIYHDDFDLIKGKIREEAQGRKPWGEAIFNNQTYDVYLNLPTVEPISNDYVYLVEKGGLEAALAQPDPFYTFTYLEFRRAREVKPFGKKTLQLGTFSIPVSKGWWTLFANESKPAIYLYPEEPTPLRIKLNPAGQLTVSDPPYEPETGWEVIAYPDGTIEVKSQSYSYLFYEAELDKVWVNPEGFIIAGKDLVKFFKQTLPKLGLNEQETQDFIDYWMSRLSESQPYYFIHFLDNDQIEQLEPLTIESLSQPRTSNLEPRTSIRLRAYFKPLEKPIEIESQILPKPLKRQGFTLVEWGGILDD